MKPITPTRILTIFLFTFPLALIFTIFLQLLDLWTEETPIRFTVTTLLILPAIAAVIFLLYALLVPRLISSLKSRGGWWTRFRLLWLENSLFFFMVMFFIDISDIRLESGVSEFNLLSTLVGSVVGGLFGGLLLAWATPKDEKGETEGGASTLVSSGDSSGS